MAVNDSLGIRYFAPPTVKTAPVVMVHGFAATGLQVWQNTGWVRKLLESGSPVFVLDLPFHGRRWLRRQTPVQLSEPEYQDVLAVEGEQLMGATASAIGRWLAGLEQGAHLVGFSAGARVVYEVAAAAPSLIRSLTIGGLPRHNNLTQLKNYLVGREYRGLTPALVDIVNNSWVLNEGLISFVEGAKDFSFDPDSLYPRCPTLLVTGENDTVAPDSVWLQESLEAHGTAWRAVTLEKRDHVNALTSGVFKRETIAWIQHSEENGQ